MSFKRFLILILPFWVGQGFMTVSYYLNDSVTGYYDPVFLLPHIVFPVVIGILFAAETKSLSIPILAAISPSLITFICFNTDINIGFFFILPLSNS